MLQSLTICHNVNVGAYFESGNCSYLCFLTLLYEKKKKNSKHTFSPMAGDCKSQWGETRRVCLQILSKPMQLSFQKAWSLEHSQLVELCQFGFHSNIWKYISHKSTIDSGPRVVLQQKPSCFPELCHCNLFNETHAACLQCTI